MNPTINPTEATLGAFISNVDLANLSDAEWDIIEDAFHEYGLLIFPQQNVDEEAQVNFSRRFGDLEFSSKDRQYRAVPVSNEGRDGMATDASQHQTQILRGNEGWHTDSSYMPLAAKASCLSAIRVPSHGGQTAWADMRAGYAALSEELKAKIADLSAYHSLYYSQSVIGHKVDPGLGYGFHKKGAPVRPLVKVHPVTGRKALYLGCHAYRIPGMDDNEAKALLQELLEFACQPPRTYEHNWKVGDLCIWDNRCVLHRARPYDYCEIRIMRHKRVSGDPRTELVDTVPDELAELPSTAAGG